jgi:hypothetical protein
MLIVVILNVVVMSVVKLIYFNHKNGVIGYAA